MKPVNEINIVADENANNAHNAFKSDELSVASKQSSVGRPRLLKKKKTPRSKTPRLPCTSVSRPLFPSSSLSIQPQHSSDTSVTASSVGTSSAATVASSKSFIHVLVERLLSHEEAPSAVDTLLAMKLYQEEHLSAREEFSNTLVCEYLIKAMQAQRENVDMQYKSCGVLEALTCQHNANKTTFHTAGAATLIVRAMRDFPDHENMQRYGCGALCNLSSLHSHQDNVVEAGGIEVVLAAMRKFPEHVEIQKFSSYCLCHLVWFSKDNKKLVISKGGGLDLAETQHRFFGEGSQVEEAATQALKKLHG